MSHASDRARQRFHVDLSREDFCEMIRLIRAGKAEYVADVKHNRRALRVLCPPLEKKVTAIVDERDFICTILPENNVHVRWARRKRYREVDADWIEDESEAFEFDADALADVLVNALRGDVANDVLAVKLKEAGVAL